ncbi:Bis(5'-nucleosyl)-tetraphosphatase, symmetrical [invertebrate metagenome]|uniref:bis(5'-nucleosyl)-tetraphosphatase (symmetrical) n=1 Tax=invertebrate metagenome TaxID=1711999 RepID=A0A2H9T425_9ZZZZ
MATYAIGDIQGCYVPLRRLLDYLAFDPGKDTLWVTGDLVNRGADSLSTLRFLKSLGSSCVSILGNHDLFLLAAAEGILEPRQKDTISTILTAPDRGELLDWLRHRPLLHHDPKRKMTMVHAGIPPIWTMAKAQSYAEKISRQLQKPSYPEFLASLFKTDKPLKWDKSLSCTKKLRLAVNYLTRMRFCDVNGHLELCNKTADAQDGYAPWFSFKNPDWKGQEIVFGHWAALEGKTGLPNIHGLDTGCVWGRYLTAMNLKTKKRMAVDYKGRLKKK